MGKRAGIPLQTIYCGKDEYLLVMKISPDLAWAVTQYQDPYGSRYLCRRSRLFYKEDERYMIHRDGHWFDLTEGVVKSGA